VDFLTGLGLGEKAANFVGADVTYEDLELLTPDDYAQFDVDAAQHDAILTAKRAIDAAGSLQREEAPYQKKKPRPKYQAYHHPEQRQLAKGLRNGAVDETTSPPQPPRRQCQPADEPRQKKKRVCRYWKSGTCRFGDKCDFLHPPLPVGPVAVA